MQWLKCTRSVKPVAVVLVALLLSGCIVIRDSPAPGCVKSIGLPLAGGCFGKTAILDLTVEPDVECLAITVNNCNGGILDVDNSCDETLALGGVEIASSDRVGLDVIEGGEGEYLLVEESSNFSNYVPEVDQRIEIVGTLREQEIKVSFTKTAKLCE